MLIKHLGVYFEKIIHKCIYTDFHGDMNIFIIILGNYCRQSLCRYHRQMNAVAADCSCVIFHADAAVCTLTRCNSSCSNSTATSRRGRNKSRRGREAHLWI